MLIKVKRLGAIVFLLAPIVGLISCNSIKEDEQFNLAISQNEETDLVLDNGNGPEAPDNSPSPLPESPPSDGPGDEPSGENPPNPMPPAPPVPVPGDGNAPPPAPEDNPNVVKLACDQARARGMLKVFVDEITFPANVGCEWSSNGNLSKKDRVVRARHEYHAVSRKLPSDVRLCDMAIVSPAQEMNYDDEILFLMHNYVIMASTDYKQSLRGPYQTGLKVVNNKFVEYAWTTDSGIHQLRDLFYGWGVTPNYCLGNCRIPPTQKTGPIEFTANPDDIVELALLGGTKFDIENPGHTPITFSRIVTGDNNNRDCRVSRIDFFVIYQGVLKQEVAPLMGLTL